MTAPTRRRGPLTPSLYRVAVTALVLAGLANILLWRVSSSDDWFANLIAALSGVTAVLLVASGLIPAVRVAREEALLLSFMVWSANLVEFALEDTIRWESRVRSCGFFLAFAVLALGTYLAQRLEREH